MTGRYLNPQLTQRMPQAIIDKIEKFAEERGITRTKAINEATEFYADSKECIMCGAVNNGNGKMCSVCYSELFTDEEIKNAIVDMLTEDMFDEYSTLRSDYPEMLKNIDKNQLILERKQKGSDNFVKTPLNLKIEPILERSKSKTTYSGKIHFVTDDGIDLVINGIDPVIPCKPEYVYMFAERKYGKIPKETKKALKEAFGKKTEDAATE